MLFQSLPFRSGAVATAWIGFVMPLVALGLLAGCADLPFGFNPPAVKKPASIPTSQLLRKPGGFYTDDGPDGALPIDLEILAEPVPRPEPMNAEANQPYSVPIRTRLHSTHNPRAIQKAVDGIMDVSYAAAYRLGFVQEALANIEVESVLPPVDTATPAPTGQTARVQAPESAPELKTEASQPRFPIASEPGRIYLQLGAFSNPDNAENFSTRVRREPGWLQQAL